RTCGRGDGLRHGPCKFDRGGLRPRPPQTRGPRRGGCACRQVPGDADVLMRPRSEPMGRLRTFIGVDIGKTIRDRAVALQEKLARESNGVKWVEPENLHVTLLFLGEVDEREVPSVCRAVSEQTQKHPAFTMSVE